MIVVNKDRFQSLANEFYTACKVRLVLYDENGNLIYKHQEMSTLCTELWKSPSLYQRCQQANLCGIQTCFEKQGVHLYTCHIGFREVVTPIQLNGVTVGYLMFGQLIDETVDIDRLRKVLIQKCDSHHLDTQTVLEKLDNTPVMRSQEIASIANIMDMCYRYMLLSEIITIQDLTLPQMLKNYVESNYTQNLSTADLCATLGISRSLLYKTSIEIFGCGVSQYINKLRLERARVLLETTDKKISEIAVSVGIPDYSYFTKVFKKYFGETPRELRTKFSNVIVSQTQPNK